MRCTGNILLVLITLFPIYLESQISMAQRTVMPKNLVIEEPGDVFKVRIQNMGGFERYLTVQGSPYIDDEFQEGKWIVKGQFERKVKMRHHAYHDEIQLIQNGKQVLMVKEGDVEASIAGKRYQYRNFLEKDNIISGYLIPLNKGKTKLYVRHIKIVRPPWLPLNGYDVLEPPKFETKTIYYIERLGKTPTPLQDLSRKEVFAVLWDKYSKLRKYARKNKLWIRTEEEAIAILAYYDSLRENTDSGK